MTEVSQSLEDFGYSVLRETIPKSFIRRLKSHFSAVRRRMPIQPDTWHSWLFNDDSEWHRLVKHSALVEIAEKVTGPHPIHLSSHYWVKSPRSAAIVPWHQDSAFFRFRGGDLATLWIPLDSATRKSGCLQVIEGSHKKPLARLIATSGGQLKRRAVVPQFSDQYNFLEVRPGDVVVLSGRIMHMSGQNITGLIRRAFSIRIIPYGVEILKPKNWDHKLQLS